MPSRFDKPHQRYIFTSLVAGIIATAVPILVMTLMQIRIQSFHDINNALMGLNYSLTLGVFMHGMIACFIGGLRPSFFATCQPE